MNPQTLLNLVISPEIEDAMVDWLLLDERIDGFTSLPVSGHGSSIHALSTAEQVAGRRRQLLLQIVLPSDLSDPVIRAISRDFGGSGMHYWALPLAAAGHLG